MTHDSASRDRRTSRGPSSGPQNVIDAIVRWAERSPDAPAVVASNQPPISYGKLVELLESTQTSLAASGVATTDRVALLMPNGPTMALTLLGVMAHATAAPLNPQYTADELSFYFSDLRPSLLVLDASIDTPAVVWRTRSAFPSSRFGPRPTRSPSSGMFLGNSPLRSRRVGRGRRASPAHIGNDESAQARAAHAPQSAASAANVATSLELVPDDRLLERDAAVPHPRAGRRVCSPRCRRWKRRVHARLRRENGASTVCTSSSRPGTRPCRPSTRR